MQTWFTFPFAFSQDVGLALPLSHSLPLIHWEYLFTYDQASGVSYKTDELTDKMLGLGWYEDVKCLCSY